MEDGHSGPACGHRISCDHVILRNGGQIEPDAEIFFMPFLQDFIKAGQQGCVAERRINAQTAEISEIFRLAVKKILRLAIDATPTISRPDWATATRWAYPSTSIMEKKLGSQSVVSEMRPDMEFLLIRAHICASSSRRASRTTVPDGNLRNDFVFIWFILNINVSQDRRWEQTALTPSARPIKIYVLHVKQISAAEWENKIIVVEHTDDVYSREERLK